MGLDSNGRCCGKKPRVYKRDGKLCCGRCQRAYGIATGQQVQNWAWHEVDGEFVPTALAVAARQNEGLNEGVAASAEPELTAEQLARAAEIDRQLVKDMSGGSAHLKAWLESGVLVTYLQPKRS